MPKKEEVKEVEAPQNPYVVLADFELDGVAYKEGDGFTPHANMQEDKAFTEFRNIDRKKGAFSGLAFTKPGEITKEGERVVRVVVLPVKAKE